VGFESAGAWWDGTGIYVNENQSSAPAAALAALIAHEATHADYYYYPDAWIGITMARHSDLAVADIHIPGNSYDQEYNAFCNQMSTWLELKGSATDSNNDAWLSYYNQGEAEMRSEIRTVYRSVGIELPEY